MSKPELHIPQPVTLPPAYEDELRNALLACRGYGLRGTKQTNLTVFWPVVTPRYGEGRELMVVGRAVNRWLKKSLDLAAVDYESQAKKIYTEARSKFRESLEWVTRKRLKNGYCPGRSQFWSVTRRVAGQLLGDTWYDQIAWSNLYKIAPSNGGNPGSVLRRGQRPAAQWLLSTELRSFLPRRVLFLTGQRWAEPFIDPEFRAIELTSANDGLLAGYLDQAAIVVAPHPQGHKLDRLAAAVTDAFNSLTLGAATASKTQAVGETGAHRHEAVMSLDPTTRGCERVGNHLSQVTIGEEDPGHADPSGCGFVQDGLLDLLRT